jgi:hypothetical protein
MLLQNLPVDQFSGLMGTEKQYQAFHQFSHEVVVQLFHGI